MFLKLAQILYNFFRRFYEKIFKIILLKVVLRIPTFYKKSFFRSFVNMYQGPKGQGTFTLEIFWQFLEIHSKWHSINVRNFLYNHDETIGRAPTSYLTRFKLGLSSMSKTMFFTNCLLFFFPIFLVELFGFNCKSLPKKFPGQLCSKIKKGKRKDRISEFLGTDQELYPVDTGAADIS